LSQNLTNQKNYCIFALS